MLYEKLAGAEIDGVAPQHARLGRLLRALDRRTCAPNLPQDPSPFYAVSWFVYPLGAALLTRGWLEGGNAAVRALGGELPAAARSATWSDVRDGMPIERGAARSTAACSRPSSASTRAGYDRFGAMQLYAFLDGRGRGGARRLAASRSRGATTSSICTSTRRAKRSR